MTIVNMVGGGASEDVVTKTFTGNLFIKGNTVTATNSRYSPGFAVTMSSYRNWTFKRDDNIASAVIDPPTVTSTSESYMYRATLELSSVTSDDIYPMLRSVCPSGKSFSVTMSGYLATSAAGNSPGYAPVTIKAVGDENSITYTELPGVTKYKAGSNVSSFQCTFVPLSIAMTFD